MRTRYYGLQAIKRSFVHFVLGKGVSAVSSLIIIVLVIRQLSVTEFAAYATMHALVLIIGLVSGFGVNPLLLRFLPELRAAGNNRAMYRLLALGIALRVVLYALAAAILLWFSEPLGTLLKLGDWAWLLPAYLVVGFLRINATFTVGALESLLWQREAQYSLALVNCVKLAAVLIIVSDGGLDLKTFVLIEFFAELATLILLLGAAFLRWLNEAERSAGDGGVLLKEARRYLNFSSWTYVQNLTSILYGSAPNRLFVSYFLPTESIAVFGVVDRLIAFVRRYEPLRIFIGMVRPIFNARFEQAGDFPKLVSLADLLFRINLIVLILPLILFAIAGEPLFLWLTAGNYPEAAMLFLAFYMIIIFGSVDAMLDILVKVVEHSRIYTVSNLALSASICLAIPLIPYMGVWSLALANGAGLLLSFVIIMAYLKRVGYGVRPDWGLTILIAGITAGSIALGHVARLSGIPLIVSVVLAYAGFFLALYRWPPLLPGERALLDRVLLKGRGRSQKPTANEGVS